MSVALGARVVDEAEKLMIDEIVDKWAEQGAFIHFVDGNVQNCGVDNLNFVDLEWALERAHVAKVDWDMELTDAERAFVLDDEKRPLLLSAYKFKTGRSIYQEEWTPDDNGVVLTAGSAPITGLVDETSNYIFIFSEALSGALKDTVILVCNIVKEDEEAKNDCCGLLYFLHHRAFLGAPIEPCQVISQENETFLLVAPSERDVALFCELIPCLPLEPQEEPDAPPPAPLPPSPSPPPPPPRAERRLLVALPMIQGETKADYKSLQAVVADFAAHLSADGFFGSPNQLPALQRVIGNTDLVGAGRDDDDDDDDDEGDRMDL